MNITVIGAGAWGTALASLLLDNGHSVVLWGNNPDRLREMELQRVNNHYLPGVMLSEELRYEHDLQKAVSQAECLVLAVPSKVFRNLSAQLGNFSGIVVSVTKGIEFSTGLTMSGILGQTMPKARHAVLSGPTLALEVARKTPAAVVLANHSETTAAQIQGLFHRPTFRVYTSADILGVEFGGALKNVIAIAAGMCDGLQFGDNTKAALVTRGLAEIKRLGVACGANGETFGGLSGFGDLIVTCFSKLSRNRTFGERLAKGESVEQILQGTASIAEGFPTAASAHHLAAGKKVHTPIIDEVHAMLYEKKNVAEAARDLLSRDCKPED